MEKALKYQSTSLHLVFFFPNTKAELEEASQEYKKLKPYHRGKPLRYASRTSFPQAVSIPLRYRFKEDDYADELSTSCNAGIAYGLKETYVNARKLYFPDNGPIDKVAKIALAGGGFLGLTPIGVSPATTENKVAATRNGFGVTYGAIGAVGRIPSTLA